MNTMRQTLLDAFAKSGMSMNAWTLAAGVPYMATHGFVKHNRNIALDTVDRLARVLGLELRPVRKGR